MTRIFFFFGGGGGGGGRWGVVCFWSNHKDRYIPSSWMVHAGCVFIAGIHPSRAWKSGSFGSVERNACVHRQDLGLYSHPKEFGGELSQNP